MEQEAWHHILCYLFCYLCRGNTCSIRPDKQRPAPDTELQTAAERVDTPWSDGGASTRPGQMLAKPS
jgi:hypothetical protein